MHCHGCEHIIETSVRKLPGIRTVKANYPTETVAVAFDPAATSLDKIRATIEQAGYRTYELDDPKRRRSAVAKLAGLILGVAGILLIIFFDTEWISQGGEPDISQHMSLGLIFLLGLLTGFHCVGMCGGFVLSYTADDAGAGRPSYLSHLLYGVGKTLSYTVIGATFGLLGAFVAFTPLLRGVAGMLAGGFLIVFGLNMLGLFAPLRRFRLGLPVPLQTFIYEKQSRSRHRPFVIGLLNGLMLACGPLQAMYVMAAGTGSALEGAKMLFAFSVGTLPVLLSFGVLATFISGALTHRLLRASGVIVVVLGAVMINRGLILTGSGYDLHSIVGSVSRMVTPLPRPSFEAQSPPVALVRQEQSLTASELQAQRAPTTLAQLAPRPHRAFQIIEMDVITSGYSPNHFVLSRGIPVKWIINGKQVTSCNHRIIVPSLNLEFDVKKGRQTIEFTPTKAGVIPWSCWMGMLHGDFEVIEPPPVAPAQLEIAVNAPAQPAPQSRPASQTIEMDVIASGFSPNHFVLSRGIPVKWVINGKQVTSCNHRIIVPSLNLEFDVKKGLQTIEFTPTKTGVIPWSCWMGMLHGDFEVIEPPAAPARPEIVTNAPTQPEIAANPPAEPAKGIAPPNAVAPSAPAGASSYTIVSRDTLRGVAIKLLRDARRWRDIAAVNPGLDARRLRPGQVIKLPEAPNEGSPGR
jgi:sulfite exporter TauE/SafE/plastocyanin domain-containing protein/copper chaperone CopZ